MEVLFLLDFSKWMGVLTKDVVESCFAWSLGISAATVLISRSGVGFNYL